MKCVIQRVSEASVTINGHLKSKIGQGYLLLVGVQEGDDSTDIEWLSNKIVNLRIFSDEDGLMNLSINDIKGEILVISQFTLHAKTKKGNRPSFLRAAKPELAEQMYKEFKDQIRSLIDAKVLSGEFGADMKVALVNDGPVTLIIDTKNKD